MTTDRHQSMTEVEQAVDYVFENVGPNVVLGIPLGLGKPNQFVNALYERVKNNTHLSLKIITALSLEKPKPKNEIQARLAVPLIERVFGGYEELKYIEDIRNNTVPSNIEVSEFYFKAGAFKQCSYAQQHYISANYTHVAQLLLDMRVNVIAQLVAEDQYSKQGKISLSCNTDVFIDLLNLLENTSSQPNYQRPLIIGQVHADLPVMRNRALVSRETFDCIIKNERYNTRLFSTPNQKVAIQDHAIGFRVSTLIKDGGTLQIGIGALGDAIVHSLKIRQLNHSDYRRAVKVFQGKGAPSIDNVDSVGVEHRPFEIGLYGSSEMFINGFMHLIESGIVKRKVYDHIGIQTLINQDKLKDQIDENTLAVFLEAGLIKNPLSEEDVQFLKHWGVFKDGLKYQSGALFLLDQQYQLDLNDTKNYALLCQNALGTYLKHGIYMHGGFFLGPEDFYAKLRSAPESMHQHIGMDSVGEINQLLFNPVLKKLQRQNARFINTTMMVTLSGACVSDALEDGTVISGIGGQYNFVAMAHDIPGACSIICVRSTRFQKGKRISNIVTNYGHSSIPRHLRDIVVTEYGIAYLRGKTDAQVMKALINVSDSEFQPSLLEFGKEQGKIEAHYQIPERYTNNTPEQLKTIIKNPEIQPLFTDFPLGTDFTEEEIALMESLNSIKAQFKSPGGLIKQLFLAFFNHNEIKEKEALHFLERMQLTHPKTPKEVLLQHLLLLELEQRGYLRAL